MPRAKQNNNEYPLDYFLAKVIQDDESDCQLWIAAKYSNGYGHICWRGNNLLAHRVAWEYENGPVPDGMYICHTCDNPACVNVSHLFLGTPRDNQQDMIQKGRAANARGAKQGAAKLTEEEVLLIKKRLKNGAKVGTLAKEFGLSHTTISNINTGKQWAWLKETSPDGIVEDTFRCGHPRRPPYIYNSRADGRSRCRACRAKGRINAEIRKQRKFRLVATTEKKAACPLQHKLKRIRSGVWFCPDEGCRVLIVSHTLADKQESTWGFFYFSEEEAAPYLSGRITLKQLLAKHGRKSNGRD